MGEGGGQNRGPKSPAVSVLFSLREALSVKETKAVYAFTAHSALALYIAVQCHNNVII